MKRFFVENIEKISGSFNISGQEANHIRKVMRMEKGDRFILMDGKGARYQALIISFGIKGIEVNLEKSLPSPLPSPINITLCQSLLKSNAMDDVIRKTSELGVSRIIPFISKRTVARIDRDRFPHKVKHWREIAINATKQSNRFKPPEIRFPLSFDDLLTDAMGEKDILKFILWEEEGSHDFKSLFRSNAPAGKIIGIIGPEGGLSREEVLAANDSGFNSVSLGRGILKADTAAIIMTGIIQYEWGDLGLYKSGLTTKNTKDTK